MISLKILEIKPFMARLFTKNTFDYFNLKELNIQTFTNFHVSGQFNEEFFSKEELEERGELSLLWSDIRPFAFSVIKGNKTPLSLKIVFQLPSKKTQELMEGLVGRFTLEELGGLYLNIRFEKGQLHIITGVAMRTFTMDKTLEQVWDRVIKNLLKEEQIPFEEE